MENKEIMERLLQDDKPQKTAERSTGASAKANNGDASISRIRVVTAKYKVYIVLLFIFIALLLIVYIPKANNAYEASKNAYSQVKTQLTSIEASIRDAEMDMDYLCNDTNGVVRNEELLKTCLNDREGCANLPETWRTGTGEDTHYDLSIPLSYLQLHSLYNKKMPVDEKRVLKNLNEYLIKRDMLGEDKRRVGDIIRIEIGDPESLVKGDEHFFQVPVDVEIEFGTIGDLTGFLYNVEKKIIDEGEDRILYKIQSVSYDIVTNDEPQDTDIEMMAYYYHDDQFDDKEECSTEDGDNGEYNNQGSEESDSGSFFKNLLNKFKK